MSNAHDLRLDNAKGTIEDALNSNKEEMSRIGTTMRRYPISAKMRKCLSCGDQFKSHGMRICNRCKENRDMDETVTHTLHVDISNLE